MTDSWDNAQEVQSNWMKFEKVGDKIKGTLLKRVVQPGQKGFSDQLVCELKKEDGSIWNVGISMKKIGTVSRLNNCKIGEIIGILFESESEPPSKGLNMVKNLKIFTFGMDENYDELDGGEEVEEEKVPEM